MTMVDSPRVATAHKDEEDADYAENVIRYGIRHYMDERGMDQGDLAKALHVSRGAVSQMLTGYSRLKFRQIFLSARVLGVSIDDLFEDVLPRFFVMPETNRLALRAPEC